MSGYASRRYDDFVRNCILCRVGCLEVAYLTCVSMTAGKRILPPGRWRHKETFH